MTEGGIPNILNRDPDLLPEEPEEDTPPSVSPSLVEHLRKAFPVRLPPQHETSPSFHLSWNSDMQGQQRVIDYLANLVQHQNGDKHVLPGTQAEDQSPSSRAPGPRPRR